MAAGAPGPVYSARQEDRHGAAKRAHAPAPPPGPETGEGHIEPARRIYVNRNLRMRNVRMIGFDMDYTLAVYDKLVLENLAFEATRAKLIADLHYPEAIAGLRYDPQCVIRGLVVDKRLGNVLKIDQYGYVTRAHHGLRLIPSEPRKTLYRNSRIRLSSDRYKSIDTLFGFPEATLFLQLVDHFEVVQKSPWKDYTHIYDDVRACIDRAHADDTIKKEIIADLARFIVQDPRLPLPWRRSGPRARSSSCSPTPRRTTRKSSWTIC